MGAPGSRRLKTAPALRAALVAAILPIGSFAQSIHFDGVDGSPAWAERVEASVRDSLRARGADLWAAESLVFLKERNEWPGPERTTQQISFLAKRTKRTVVAWAKSNTPEGRFQRPWWSVLWTRRVWTAQADVFVADATGKITVSKASVTRRIWLGFTGTNGADLWPVTEPERSKAEALVLAELTSKVAAILAASGGEAK